MRRVSKIMLSIAGISAIISILSALAFSFVFLVLKVMALRYLRYYIPGMFNYYYYGDAYYYGRYGYYSRYTGLFGSNVIFDILIEYASILTIIHSLLTLVAAIVLVVAFIFCIKGFKGKKSAYVTNIVFGLTGGLPALAIGTPVLLLSLSILGSFGYFVFYYIPKYFYELYLLTTLSILIPSELFASFFAIAGIVSIISGLLFGLSSITGGVLGLIANKKEQQ